MIDNVEQVCLSSNWWRWRYPRNVDIFFKISRMPICWIIYWTEDVPTNKNATQMIAPRFGYFSGLLTQGNTPGPFSFFSSPMVWTIGVEAMFVEQHSDAVGSSCPIIQNPMATSLMVVVVRAGQHSNERRWLG